MRLEFLPEGSDDCPLIRLYDFDCTEVARLFADLSALASRERESIAVHDLPGVESISECRLFLRTGTRDRCVVQLPAPSSFECVLTPESWDNVAGLAEPFLSGNDGCQWLVTSGDAKWLLSTDGHW
jgi:hypothetical protein